MNNNPFLQGRSLYIQCLQPMMDFARTVSPVRRDRFNKTTYFAGKSRSVVVQRLYGRQRPDFCFISVDV
jgi:hypothetical protein